MRLTWTHGPVADAVRASTEGRLRRFIRDADSEPVKIFDREHRADAGDWYGEHLGKWLIAASHAALRTDDAELAASVTEVVAHVLAQQESDGYLGTYTDDAVCRLTHPESEKGRTWDLWVHAWTIKGLLTAAEVPGVTGAVEAALRIGDLLVEAFRERSLLDSGNHAGLSSAVLIEPLAELSLLPEGDPKYAALALRTVDEMDARGLFPHGEVDVSALGTGKAYQMLWVATGFVTLWWATSDSRLLDAATAIWADVERHHLTPLGGPWGGVGKHKECFNERGLFSPYGMVETCSAASWMALSRELFRVTGEEKYIAAFERTFLNTLLGAVDPGGREWCYFTFPNGHRHHTYHWACCKSSGAMALEEASAMVVTPATAGISVNLLLPCEGELDGFHLRIEETSVEIQNAPGGSRTLSLRIPGGTNLRSATLNGDPLSEKPTGGYLTITREWQPGDRIRLDLETPIRVHPLTYSLDHHGQEVVRQDYACVSRGPYVYATGLIDGYRREETLCLARLNPESWFRATDERTIELRQPGRDPIVFQPYFEAGGRHDGAWRATWMGVAWQ